jgi:hypothetical protein
MPNGTSVPPFDGEIPDDLLLDMRRGKCVLFVGAGLSRQVLRSNGMPLPNWEQLLEELAKRALDDGTLAANVEVIDAIHRGQLLEAAQELQDTIPSATLAAYFLAIFGDKTLRPSFVHRAIPPLRLRAVLTSNYDSLVEDTYEELYGTKPLCLTYQDYSRTQDPIRNRRFFIYKIHGDYRRIFTVVLGTRQYQQVIHMNPGYRWILHSLLGSYTVLFIGFSGTDPDLNHALDATAAWLPGEAPLHYMALPAGQWTAVQRRRARIDRGVHVIEYDPSKNHLQLGALLYELLKGKPRYPARRALITVHHADRPLVQGIEEHLARLGYRSVWLDLMEFNSPAWFSELRAQLEFSDAAVHFVSNRCLAECGIVGGFSRQLCQQVIPILLGGVSAPPSLSGLPSVCVPEPVDLSWLDSVRGVLDGMLGPPDPTTAMV